MTDWTVTELTADLVERILSLVASGHRPDTACRLAGVHRDDFSRWIDLGSEVWGRPAHKATTETEELAAQLYRMIDLVDGQGLGYWEGEYFRAVRERESVYAQNCLIVLKARWPEIWEKGPKDLGGGDDSIDEELRKLAQALDAKPGEPAEG